MNRVIEYDAVNNGTTTDDITTNDNVTTDEASKNSRDDRDDRNSSGSKSEVEDNAEIMFRTLKNSIMLHYKTEKEAEHQKKVKHVSEEQINKAKTILETQFLYILDENFGDMITVDATVKKVTDTLASETDSSNGTNANDGTDGMSPSDNSDNRNISGKDVSVDSMSNTGNVNNVNEKNVVDNVNDVNDDSHVEYHSVSLLSYAIYTEDFSYCIKNDINIMAQATYTNLLITYMHMLFAKHSQKLTLGNFIDDKEYLDYLEEHNFHLMFGSKWHLLNRDWAMSKEFEHKTKDYTWIVATSSISWGIAMKTDDVHFFIRKINVEVRPAMIEQSHLVKSMGSYSYEVRDGVRIPFRDRTELENYVGAEKKIISIKAQVGIKVNDSASGIYR